MNQDVESKHNLYTQSSPNPHADVEYARDPALLIARAMVDFYHKSTTNTWSFGQQHILQKGLKMFKEKGHAAAMKNWISCTRECVSHQWILMILQQVKRKKQWKQ